MIVCDTSGLIAFFDAGDRNHASVAEVIESDPGPFLVSPFVLAELDYLVQTRRGIQAELAMLAELTGGAWQIASMDAADVRSATDVIAKYDDLGIGLTDASLVVIAQHHRADRLLTLDRRHFPAVRQLHGKPFTVLPAM